MPTISKNIGWSTLTSLLQLYTGSIVFIVLAKLMSVNDFGILSFGYSLSAIIIIVADFGFSLMIIKDYPRLNRKSLYLTNSIVSKGIISSIAVIIFGFYLIFIYKDVWFWVGIMFLFFSIFASFIIYLQALLRVQNQFKKYNSSSIVYAIGISLVIFIYCWNKIDLIIFTGLLAIVKLIQLLWLIWLCRSSFKTSIYSINKVKSLLKNTKSFGFFNILGILYFMVDTQIISIYLGAIDISLYQSVFRIVLVFMLLSDILSNVLLPFLSYKFHLKEDLSELTSHFFLYLLIVGCSIFLFFTTFRIELLKMLYTEEYLMAEIIVFPFSIVLILRMVSSILGNILTISNLQRARVLTVGIALFFSLVLNIFLVPIYGIIAAAWTSVIVHLILFIGYVFFSKKQILSLNFISVTNILVIGVMSVIYLVIAKLETGNYFIIATSIVVWFCFIFFIMRRNNNFIYLKKILSEQGTN